MYNALYNGIALFASTFKRLETNAVSFYGRLLLLTLIITLPAQPAIAFNLKQTSTREMEAEQYAVYSALISALIKDRRGRAPVELVVIINRTTRDIRPHYLTGLTTQETYDDYKTRSKESYALKDSFELPVKFVLIEEMESKLENFAKKYPRPRSSGAYFFSSVGLNRNMTEALVYMEMRCGLSCGDATGIALVKINERWTIKRSRLLWVR